MEKLQKALQKARSERSETRKPAPSDERPASVDPAMGLGTGTGTGATASWDDIPLRNLDKKSLDANLLFSFTADKQSTAFDVLRTKTQLMMQKNGWSRLGITSATPSCGKTTLACNLALGFARQQELRVVLIEVDLRRPSISRMLKIEPEHDVSEMLTGNLPFSQQAVRVGQNVSISIARGPLQDPTSILLSQKTKETLTAIEETYAPDIMLFDLPPILTGDDTRAFLKHVDATLLVAKAGTSSVSQIDNSEREIAEHTNVLGVVLNQARLNDEDSDYDYYYY